MDVTDDLDDRILDRILSREQPEITAWVKLFPNSPKPSPFVLRLLSEEQDNDMRKFIGALSSQEEKEGAYIREPLVYGVATIDGQTVPNDLTLRRKLFYRLDKPIIATLYRAYQDLDGAELAAQQAIAQAKNLPGADSGPSSAPKGPGPIDDSPLPPSPADADVAS